MTALATLTRMINERQRDIAELQAELDVLRKLEAKPALHPGNGEDTSPPLKGRGRMAKPKAPRKITRQAMLRGLIKDSGRAGLPKNAIIERMAALCDSSPNSINSMLSLLARKRQIVSPERGRWRALYAR